MTAQSQVIFGTISNVQYLQSGDAQRPFVPEVTLNSLQVIKFKPKERAVIAVKSGKGPKDWTQLTVGHQVSVRVTPTGVANSYECPGSTYVLLGQQTPPEFKTNNFTSSGGSSNFAGSNTSSYKSTYDVTGMTVGGLFHDASCIEAAAMRNTNTPFDLNRMMGVYHQLLLSSEAEKKRLKTELGGTTTAPLPQATQPQISPTPIPPKAPSVSNSGVVQPSIEDLQAQIAALTKKSGPVEGY